MNEQPVEYLKLLTEIADIYTQIGKHLQNSNNFFAQDIWIEPLQIHYLDEPAATIHNSDFPTITTP